MLRVSLSPHERELVEALAKRERISVSECVRALIVERTRELSLTEAPPSAVTADGPASSPAVGRMLNALALRAVARELGVAVHDAPCLMCRATLAAGLCGACAAQLEASVVAGREVAAAKAGGQ